MNILIVIGFAHSQLIFDQVRILDARYVVFLDQSCYIDIEGECKSVSMLNIVQYCGKDFLDEMPDFDFRISSDSVDSTLRRLIRLYTQNINLVASLLIRYIYYLREQHESNIRCYLMDCRGVSGHAIGPSGIDSSIVIQNIIELNQSLNKNVPTSIQFVFGKKLFVWRFASSLKNVGKRIILNLINMCGIFRLSLLVASKKYKTCNFYLGDGLPYLGLSGCRLNIILCNSVLPVAEVNYANTVCFFYSYNSINSLLKPEGPSSQAIRAVFLSGSIWLCSLQRMVANLPCNYFLSDHLNVSNLFFEALLRQTGKNINYVEHGVSRTDIHRTQKCIDQDEHMDIENLDAIIKEKKSIVFVTYGIYKSTGFKSNPINYVESIAKILSHCGRKDICFARKPFAEPNRTISDIFEKSQNMLTNLSKPVKFISTDLILRDFAKEETIIIAVHHLGNAHSRLIKDGYDLLYVGLSPNQIEWNYYRLILSDLQGCSDSFFLSKSHVLC